MNNAELFEQSMARLEEIVAKLEGETLTLSESIALYKEGAELSERCRKAINEAKLTVKAVSLENAASDTE